ncbi:MAG: hypothetical protein A2173_10885 [Planctomycetes bacterium RBG_13_44_8b]|nr:MAG: hypothetical protein A2173_10885 [Planctomycetes bacterium RBG_13_44_8b]
MVSKKVLEYVNTCCEDVTLIDKFLVAGFIEFNNIRVVRNKFILKHIDLDGQEGTYREFFDLIRSETKAFTLEDLIQLFEVLVPKDDRIVNGAIYTPGYIRKYIVNHTLHKLGQINIINLKVADISCGSGAFLFDLAEQINKLTGKPFSKIYKENIFGLDITSYSIARSKILLALLAIMNNEDEEKFEFNLFTGNALSFDWFAKCKIVRENGGFDAIVGNPPYVRARNLVDENKMLMKNWEVTKTGNPDLYIPFFEIGVKYLKESGTLGYITANTFKRSVNARNLRVFFKEHRFELEILDFGNDQVFEQKSTYTCIVFISNRYADQVKYSRISPKDLIDEKFQMHAIPYDSLDSHKGWLLNSKDILNNIYKLQLTGTPLGKKFKIKNGLATLCNDIFIFKPTGSDKHYFFLKDQCAVYKIEKSICKDIVKPNKLKSEADLPRLLEKIIFPYRINPNLSISKGCNPSTLELYTETYLKQKFPNTYKYLSNKKEKLLRRDKGNGKVKYKWYEFGRTQALTDQGKKLLFPYMSNKPYFVFTDKKDLLLYAGYAIFSDSEQDLLILKKMLQSDIFWYYIRKASKPYANNYYAMAKNYVKDFAICALTAKDKVFLLHTENPKKINYFLIKKYNLELSDVDKIGI